MEKINAKLKYKFNNALKSDSAALVYHRDSLKDNLAEYINSKTKHYFLGVKNTAQISAELVEKLTADKTFILHTIDKKARGGRAVDSDLINPLTLRVMTGSTSGGCINILNGINDLALGTDGGGSVLAPAAATSLYSLMAKGFGLQTEKEKVSTDNLTFKAGIGFIAPELEICFKALKKLIDFEPLTAFKEKLNIALPEKNSQKLAQGEDMAAVTAEIETEIAEHNLSRINLKGSADRKRAIEIMEKTFAQGTEIIITAEGPVDFYGYGDSVHGSWQIGAEKQKQSGKYLMRAANLVNATAITIPTDRLGVALVLIAKPGLKSGIKLLKLAETLNKSFKRPKLFERYFLNQFEDKANNFLGVDNYDQYFR